MISPIPSPDQDRGAGRATSLDDGEVGEALVLGEKAEENVGRGPQPLPPLGELRPGLLGFTAVAAELGRIGLVEALVEILVA